MATIYKRKGSPYWWARCKGPNGGPVRRSLSIPAQKALKANAQVAANKLEIDLWSDHNPLKTRWLFEDLMTRYIVERQPGIADMRCIRNLRQFFVGALLADMAPEDVAHYKQERRILVKDSTIRRELATFSAAINFARREWGWPIPNVIEGRKPPQGKGRIRWIDREEATRLIHVAHSEAPYLGDFIEIALHTGMRKQEILGLECSRVDLHHGVIHLNPNDQKSGEYSTVPLNAVARQAILRRLSVAAEQYPGSPWLFPGRKGRITDIKRSFTSACKKVGIKDFRIHDLRHTCASWLVQDGVSLMKVKALLRHSSVTTTEKYAHLAPQDTKEAVDRLAHYTTHSSHNVVQINNVDGKGV